MWTRQPWRHSPFNCLSYTNEAKCQQWLGKDFLPLPISSKFHWLDELVFKTGFFSRYSTHGNPFDDVYVEDEVEDVLAENGVSSAIL